MQDFQTIQYKLDRHIASLVLNRPEKRNAINAMMATELIEALVAAGNDADADMLILQGAGKAFCAGADLGWMHGTSARGSALASDDPSYLLSKLFKTIFYFPKPLIIQVHGMAMGGALGLIAAGDFVLAAEDSRFAFSEVRLGLIPATISPYVIRRIGGYKARQLMLGGDVIGAVEAQNAGLVDRVFLPGDLVDETTKLCEKLSGNAPGAMKQCKQLLMHVSEQPINDHIIKYTADILDEIRHSQEAQEGMRAFREKRKAVWRRTDQL